MMIEALSLVKVPQLLEIALKEWTKIQDQKSKQAFLRQALNRDLRQILDLCATLLTRTVQDPEHLEAQAFLLKHLQMGLCLGLESGGADFSAILKQESSSAFAFLLPLKSEGKRQDKPQNSFELYEKIQSKSLQLRLIAEAGLVGKSNLKVKVRIENLQSMCLELKRFIQ